MSDGFAELRGLAENLGRIAGAAVRDVDAVAQRGALNIKNEMVADAQSSKHFHGMAGSISYESAYKFGGVRYVVGPDKARRGGSLGNIYYFGTSRGGGSGDIEKPLRSEGPRFRAELLKLADEWAGRV